MIAIKGSEFSLSNGDEPGVAGGVKSSTFMKESTWILYSFDVKIEGQGAARLTDKKFQNHENTVDAAGVAQAPVNPLGPEDPCDKLAREIDELVNRDKRQDDIGGRHGLKHRFREQINGANGPPGSGVGDPIEWVNHDIEIKNQQKGLRDRLNDFNSQNCGDKVPIPQDAWEWATKPAPQPNEWKPPAEVHSFSALDDGFMKKISKATGLTGVALVIYIIISEGSRILVPPRNLVPVP